MAIKNPTQWMAPSGKGYITSPGSTALLTQDGNILATESGVDLLTQPNAYYPKYRSAWNNTSRNTTGWYAGTGRGYVDVLGTLFITDNLGDSLVTNNGKFIVTTPGYTVPVNKTLWAASGV